MYEIERRFLVENYPTQQLIGAHEIKIRQTYLDDAGEWTIRARQTYDGMESETTMALKRIVGHGMRIEIEEKMTTRFYSEVQLASGVEIIKSRFKIPYGVHVIEFDVFHNPELKGIMIAEVELESITETLHLPEWIGREITGDDSYSNHQLFKRLAR